MTAPYQNCTVVLPDQFRHGQPDELFHLLRFTIVDRAGKSLHGRRLPRRHDLEPNCAIDCLSRLLGPNIRPGSAYDGLPAHRGTGAAVWDIIPRRRAAQVLID